MKREVLDRGYVTNALTNGQGKIYGLYRVDINWRVNTVERANKFYWSEVYVEAGYMATIIRKGKLLVGPTAEELETYSRQSEINLGSREEDADNE